MKKRVIIIAEIGCNHNGKFNQAVKLIKRAKRAGADYAKFQLFNSDEVITKNAPKANYAIKNSKKNQSQYEMQKKLELSFNIHKKLKKICEKHKIKYLSSAFDVESLNLLKKLKLGIIKVPSGEINNVLYLKHLSSFNTKVILSTGMSSLKEIKNAINILKNGRIKKNNITLLQCNTEYPSPYKDVNLKAMKNMKKIFNLKVGLSDHTLGIEVPIAAAALGAEVIEKHFTLDRNLQGPDHRASLIPDEFKKMVRSIRNIEEALGKPKKELTKSEKKNIKIVRKSLVASKLISKGEKFTKDNVSVKRPGTGIPANDYFKILGKFAKKKIYKDQFIKLK